MPELLAPAELSQQLRTDASPDMRRRRWQIGLSLLGATIGGVVAAYQTGIIKHLPEILPGDVFDSDKVDASDYAYRLLQMPDAPQMVVTYGLTASLAAAGGAKRATENPALPVATAVKAAFDLATCLYLARLEWRENGKLCSYCQTATAISAVTLALSLPEAMRAARGGDDRPEQLEAEPHDALDDAFEETGRQLERESA